MKISEVQRYLVHQAISPMLSVCIVLIIDKPNRDPTTQPREVLNVEEIDGCQHKSESQTKQNDFIFRSIKNSHK